MADAPPNWQRGGLLGMLTKELRMCWPRTHALPRGRQRRPMQQSTSSSWWTNRPRRPRPCYEYNNSRRYDLRKNGVSKPLDIDDDDDNNAHTWYTDFRPTTEAWLLVDERVEDCHVGTALFEIPVSRWACLTDATGQTARERARSCRCRRSRLVGLEVFFAGFAPVVDVAAASSFVDIVSTRRRPWRMVDSPIIPKMSTTTDHQRRRASNVDKGRR
ncbi:hypothetical protein DFP72DRAFT_427584 [Ephemerocybe angulata]|uniref:Uncharacterized protein n=1 Tax=Ephemerocybe angulata TaxID=980116 RepID=A0A8H6HUV8_9AGAR|nr:hypothetical protein DFP72DRAFT_427584 [Tulosesus angulatus]